MGFLPPNYNPATQSDESSPKSSRYFKPASLGDGESTTFRLCGTHDSGHVIAGWSYFTEAGQPRRFGTYPTSYLDDIGLTWEGKNSGSGEKAKPSYFLSFVALRKESDDFQIVTITQKGLREQLEEILATEGYGFRESGMANFFVVLKRKGVKLETSYNLVPALKVPTKAEEQRWTQIKDQAWLPALFVNGDPFEGKPADGGEASSGLPPTHRDDYGADTEVAIADSAMPASGW